MSTTTNQSWDSIHAVAEVIAATYYLRAPSVLARLMRGYQCGRSESYFQPAWDDEQFQAASSLYADIQAKVRQFCLMDYFFEQSDRVFDTEDDRKRWEVIRALRTIWDIPSRSQPLSNQDIVLARFVQVLCDYWLLASGEAVADSFPASDPGRRAAVPLERVAAGRILSFLGDAIAACGWSFTTEWLHRQLRIYSTYLPKPGMPPRKSLRLTNEERSQLKETGPARAGKGTAIAVRH